jgi:hypothetical protein
MDLSKAQVGLLSRLSNGPVAQSAFPRGVLGPDLAKLVDGKYYITEKGSAELVARYSRNLTAEQTKLLQTFRVSKYHTVPVDGEPDPDFEKLLELGLIRYAHTIFQLRAYELTPAGAFRLKQTPHVTKTRVVFNKANTPPGNVTISFKVTKSTETELVKAHQALLDFTGGLSDWDADDIHAATNLPKKRCKELLSYLEELDKIYKHTRKGWVRK